MGEKRMDEAEWDRISNAGPKDFAFHEYVVRIRREAIRARESERELAEAWREYFKVEQYLKDTEMHDNYTDRARARDRQAKAIARARELLKKAGVE